MRFEIIGEGMMGQMSLQLRGKGGIAGVGGLHQSQMGGGFHDVHGGSSWPQGGGCGRPFDHVHRLCRVDDEVVSGEVRDGHVQ